MDIIVDTHEMNLKNIQSWVKDYLRKKDEHALLTDLIMDYLESEQFPDRKTMICELADYGFLSLDEVKKLMSKLWDELEREQSRRHDKSVHSAKYQRTSSSSSSSSKVASRASANTCDSYNLHHTTRVVRYNDDSEPSSKRLHTDKK